MPMHGKTIYTSVVLWLWLALMSKIKCYVLHKMYEDSVYFHQFFGYSVVRHDRDKHHVTLPAPKAVPFLTVMSGWSYSAEGTVLHPKTDLCPADLIGSPRSHSTLGCKHILGLQE